MRVALALRDGGPVEASSVTACAFTSDVSCDRTREQSHHRRTFSQSAWNCARRVSCSSTSHAANDGELTCSSTASRSSSSASLPFPFPLAFLSVFLSCFFDCEAFFAALACAFCSAFVSVGPFPLPFVLRNRAEWSQKDMLSDVSTL